MYTSMLLVALAGFPALADAEEARRARRATVDLALPDLVTADAGELDGAFSAEASLGEAVPAGRG